MEDDKQILKDVEDELKESNEALPPAKRNKRPARLYYGVTSFVMFLYLLLSAIALGSFGEIQREISGFYGVKNRCILFAHTEPISSSDPDNEPARVSIEFKSFAPCIFLFWGLVSGIILAFFMEVYAIVMIIIAPRILNLLRVLDFILCFSSFLGFFAFGITFTAGLNTTCSGFAKARVDCSMSYLLNQDMKQLNFYIAIATAQNCSWILTVMMLALSVWNFILVIFFIKKKKASRKMKLQASVNNSYSSGPALSSSEPALSSSGQSHQPNYSNLGHYEEGGSDSPFSGQPNPYTQQK